MSFSSIFRGAAHALTGLFAICLSAAALGDEAPAAPAVSFPIIIDHALVVRANRSLASRDFEPRQVSLPDRWQATLPGYSGALVYRTAFRLDAAALAGDLLALYVERVCNTMQVQLNGHLIFSGGRMVEPVARNCGEPQLITLPSALLSAGSNVLDIRVVGYALDRVGSVQSEGGLSALEIGTRYALTRTHARQYFWSVAWPNATGFGLIGIGFVLLAVGWLNRHEVYFIYLGSLCLAWVAVSMTMSAHEFPWANEVTEFMLGSAWAVLLALAVQFFLSFAGVRSRNIESLVAVQWVLVPLSLILAGPEWLFTVSRGWFTLLACELLVAMSIYVQVAGRRRARDFGAIGLLLLVGTISLCYELAVQWQLFTPPTVSAANGFAPVMLAALGTALFLLFARAFRAIAADRNRVRDELNLIKSTLENRVEALTAQRVGQFTELERRRIASDLHDDLGAKLLTIVHTVDASRFPHLAREALEEMRLSVRGLAGKAVRLDDAIADWRAETVARLEQAGIAAWWEPVDAVDSPVLSARTFMQLTRILRESVSNVIKHSGAKNCRIECAIVNGRLHVNVVDDGRGLEHDMNRGQGMAGMKRRAKRLDGQCLVESTPGAGVGIRLSVPL